MKKLIIGLMTVLSLTLIPVQLNAKEKTVTPTTVPAPIRTEESKALELRISEINAMDKSILSSSEKKELRKEVRSDSKKVKKYQRDGVVYIGGGTLLLLIILLIILL